MKNLEELLPQDMDMKNLGKSLGAQDVCVCVCEQFRMKLVLAMRKCSKS
jgi:hypothetical protein